MTEYQREKKKAQYEAIANMLIDSPDIDAVTWDVDAEEITVVWWNGKTYDQSLAGDNGLGIIMDVNKILNRAYMEA